MCCFAGEVESVSNTRIFARMERNRQFLAYGMEFSSKDENAIILPIPAATEADVKFISLEKYPTLFDDLYAPFMRRSRSLNDSISFSDPLEVHSVGAFDASFVPTIRDFDRLDSRFRIPASFEEVPGYADFGFVVFKLKAGTNQKVHPMAFSFISNLPKNLLFFPTLHIHDGKVHETESFDHMLFAQAEVKGPEWETFSLKLSGYSSLEREAFDCGLMKQNQGWSLLRINGEWKNQDSIFSIV